MTSNRNGASGMRLADALEVVRGIRGDAVIVTAMRAALEWAKFEPHPRDLIYIPSSMGQASSIGLGIALAQPDVRVIVFNGDGSTLMNLGSLVTITSKAPANLTVVVTDNGVYDITGCQTTAGSANARANGQAIDYVQLAQACGFDNGTRCEHIDEWRDSAARLLFAAGPVFVSLKVRPQPESEGSRSPGPGPERIRRLRNELNGAPSKPHVE
ncbi:MAG: thiamine pyrophosphate-dependent enzyme [Planctomycetota bacterium]|nr:thiamine pyrophosphate-dependent enzyme [Planctomycetota bacterium]